MLGLIFLFSFSFKNLIANDAYTFFSGVPQKDDIALLAIRFLNEKENKNIKPNISKSDAA